tara:strand:+ start:218 stop:427 length:210 start_codon:yes stop_codon:yes gene_type:complete
MNKKMKYITVLDFEVGIVFQYNIEKWNLDNESCEDFIANKGHRLNNCEWMIHEFQGFHVTNCIGAAINE